MEVDVGVDVVVDAAEGADGDVADAVEFWEKRLRSLRMSLRTGDSVNLPAWLTEVAVVALLPLLL